MEAKLDMSLDQLTKPKRHYQRGGRHRGNGRTFKPRTANENRGLVSASAAAAAAAATNLDVGSKLLVSNLHFGVSEMDLKELFGSVGPLKKVSLAFDENGKSKGTAEVIFVRKNDAMLAMNKYQNVALDGRPMRMEITASSVPRLQLGGKQGPAPGGRLSRGPSNTGRGRRGRGRGGSGKFDRKKPKTAEELDAEMSEYMSTQEASQKPVVAGEDVAMSG